MIYLAGPIDAVAADQAKGWREEAIEFFEKAGIVTFSPVHAFSKGETNSTTAQAIIDINNMAVISSDYILANLSHGTSYGTPIEIELAKKHNVTRITYGLHPESIYRHWVDNHADLKSAMNAILEDYSS